jgi:hypothetical protein
MYGYYEIFGFDFSAGIRFRQMGSLLSILIKKERTVSLLVITDLIAD